MIWQRCLHGLLSGCLTLPIMSTETMAPAMPLIVVEVFRTPFSTLLNLSGHRQGHVPVMYRYGNACAARLPSPLGHE